jgi:tetratricopeptide (TPR) repeat protein
METRVKRWMVGGLAAIVLAAVFLGAGALRPAPPVASDSVQALPTETSTTLFAPQPPGDVGATISLLRARIKGNEDDWRSLALLGLAYLQNGTESADPTYYAQAQSALQRSLDITERPSFEAALGMGVLANARHDFETALRWGRTAIEANPYNAQARGVVGDALTELGRYGAATRAIQKMINLRPGLSAYARVSYARELHGDVDGAIDAMERAYNAAGHPTDRAWAAYHLGDLYFGRGQLARAEREYRRGAQLAPGYPLARAGLAKVAAGRGRVREGISILRPVAGKYPSPEVVILLGDLYHLAGMPDQARRQYDLVRAIERLYRANGVNVDLELSLFDVDHGLDQRDALERARAEYARRKSIHVADALSWALYANDRYPAARRYAREALRLGSRSALFHFHAAMIDLRLGHLRSARTHLEQVMEFNPNFSFWHKERARRLLERLSGSTG